MSADDLQAFSDSTIYREKCFINPINFLLITVTADLRGVVACGAYSDLLRASPVQ